MQWGNLKSYLPDPSGFGQQTMWGDGNVGYSAGAESITGPDGKTYYLQPDVVDGQLRGFQAYDTWAKDKPLHYFDPQGNFASTSMLGDTNGGWGEFLLPALAAGAVLGGPAIMGALGGGGGAGAAGAAELGAMGAGAEGLGAAGFNAAMDSQLANLALGSEALAGYGGSITPAVAGSGGGGLLSSLGGAASTVANAGKGLLSSVPGGLGTVASVVGGLASTMDGTPATKNTQASLDPRMDAAVYGNLLPQAQALLAQQSGQAQQVGSQLTTAGQGLLNRPVAGNGVGQVQLQAPQTASNPFLSSVAGDMERRTKSLLDQGLLGIQGRSVATGGLGGSRQGVAQGMALSNAADSLQGNLGQLYATAYEGDSNRAMNKYNADLGFFSNQRGQDLQQIGLGADLASAGMGMPWAPIKSAASVMAPFAQTASQSVTATEAKDNPWQTGLSTGLGIWGTGVNNGWWGK